MAGSSKKNERKKLFVKEFQKDLNGQKAAERAGYAPSGARAQASKFLREPEVKAQVKEDLTLVMNKVGMTVERLMTELACIATSDVSDAYDDEGKLLHPKQMPDHFRRTLTAIETHIDFTEGVEVGQTTRVKMADKLKAIELFAKMHRLLDQRVEHTGSVTLESLVAGSMEEPEE